MIILLYAYHMRFAFNYFILLLLFIYLSYDYLIATFPFCCLPIESLKINIVGSKIYFTNRQYHESHRRVDTHKNVFFFSGRTTMKVIPLILLFAHNLGKYVFFCHPEQVSLEAKSRCSRGHFNAIFH